MAGLAGGERRDGERRLYTSLGLLAVFGALTGLLEGPGSVLATDAPFALLDALAASGHHALLVGLLAAHNFGVAATLPALGRFLAGRTEAPGRVRTREAVPVFVLEGLAVLALGVPAYRALATGGRAALAPWCGLAAILVLAAAVVEIRLV